MLCGTHQCRAAGRTPGSPQTGICEGPSLFPGTSQDLEHFLGFSSDPAATTGPPGPPSLGRRNSATVSGDREQGTKTPPTRAANTNSAHHAEIALACRSLVISFVSNVLIVTDYMLFFSPDICRTAGLIFVLQYEKVTLINAV